MRVAALYTVDQQEISSAVSLGAPFLQCGKSCGLLCTRKSQLLLVAQGVSSLAALCIDFGREEERSPWYKSPLW